MSYTHLSMDERNIIYRMKFLGHNDTEIARCLGRHRSTICRELTRHYTLDGRYCPGTADAYANAKGRLHIRRPKTADTKLMAYVADRLEKEWSPEQIAGRLKNLPPDVMKARSISHATIYRWIWADAGRAKRFKQYLRVAYKKRRKPYGKPSKRGEQMGTLPVCLTNRDATRLFCPSCWAWFA